MAEVERTSKLQGKVAVITGGASGIGLATARRLHHAGAQVVLVDLDADAVAEAAREVDGAAVVADVGRLDQWPTVLGALEAMGGVDIVHLNAGIAIGQQDVTQLGEVDYRRIMAVNVDHVVYGVRALVPSLVARGGGCVVVTASLAGLVAFAGDPIYTLTKHAVVGFVRSIAPRLADQGIRVNAICPGMVDTPLIDGPVRELLEAAGFPLIDAQSVADAVLGVVTGDQVGRAVVVQAGREPEVFRFARPPGPRVPGAEGAVPPGWLGDVGEASAPAT